MTRLRSLLSRSRIGIVLLVLLQFLFALFFLWDMLTSLLRIPIAPMSWQLREMAEVGAAFGLMAGVFVGAHTLWQLVDDRNRAEVARDDAARRLRRASTAFQALMEERFAEWDLTAAERDVAHFALKGLSLSQIAAMRNTSEGTVKTQTNAIYRKAGVSGRPQFLSVFIEDLLMDDSVSGAGAGQADGQKGKGKAGQERAGLDLEGRELDGKGRLVAVAS